MSSQCKVANISKVIGGQPQFHEASQDVYIGRAGKGLPGTWGNPFVRKRGEQRGITIKRYKSWLFKKRPDLVFKARQELQAKTLWCFCSPEPCHGEVLARIANMSEAEWESLVAWMVEKHGQQKIQALVNRLVTA